MKIVKLNASLFEEERPKAQTINNSVEGIIERLLEKCKPKVFYDIKSIINKKEKHKVV